MMTGVRIGEYDTKEQWGMILLNDLTIGAPAWKSNWVPIPGADGSLNMSYGLTDGEPVYEMRQIRFSLWPDGADEESAAIKKAQLMEYCHGRERDLWLPDDDTHYYHGTFEIGDKTGYNLLQIPVIVTVDPYKYKNDVTTVQITIPSSGNVSFDLTNEQRKVIPTFISAASHDITLTDGTKSFTLPAGETARFAALSLPAGTKTLTATGTRGDSFTVQYQEAKL